MMRQNLKFSAKRNWRLGIIKWQIVNPIYTRLACALVHTAYCFDTLDFGFSCILCIRYGVSAELLVYYRPHPHSWWIYNSTAEMYFRILSKNATTKLFGVFFFSG